MKEDKDEQRVKAVELVNTELKVKYPPGSYIMFSTTCNKGEKIVTTSCAFYDKVGGKKPHEIRQRKNIVSKPPEWQNIPFEEAEKIGEMFDRCEHINLRYV
jgi:hypothetical protein